VTATTIAGGRAVGVQPGVAERAARVEPFDQAGEVRQALIQAGDDLGIRQEQLGPVRPRLERGQRRLDAGEDPLDSVLLRRPGETGCP
jgi:hypothetical protein